MNKKEQGVSFVKRTYGEQTVESTSDKDVDETRL